MNRSQKSPTNPWHFAIALAILHIAAALLFASMTPFLTPGRVFGQGGPPEGIYTVDIGAPDELQHVVHAGRLAAGESYPVFKADDPKLNFTYEALQPPAYYYLAAGWMKIMGVKAIPAFAEHVVKNDYTASEEILKRGTFEELGATRAQVQGEGLRLRILSAILGAGTVLGVFAIGFWGTGRVNVALAAATFAALLPMQVALSGAASNDPLLTTLCTWVVALLIRAARTELTVKGGLVIGLLMGLAFLTKTTALALFPIVFVALIFCRKTLPIGKFVPGLLVALILGGAWWAKNTSLYGDPFAIKIFNEAFTGRNPTAEGFISRIGASAYWQGVFTIFGHSFIGVFSYMDINMAEWVYPIGKWLFGLLAAVGLATIFVPSLRPVSDEGEESRSTFPTHLINGVCLVVLLALFVQFNRGFFQAQARYVMPAIGPIACLLGLGVAFFCDKLKNRAPLIAWILVMFVFLGQGAQVLPQGFKARVEKGIPGYGNTSN